MRFGCSSPCKFEAKKTKCLTSFIAMPNLRLGGKDAPVASKNSLSSFAFKTASLSVSLKTNLFPFCPSPRFAVDALSADRFLRMIFNLPPEELDTTMHSPGEYIKQAISTESDVRGSSTTTSLPPAFCELAIPAKTHSTCGVLNYSSKHNRTFITAVLMGNFSASPYSLISTITIIVRPGRSV